MCAPIKDSHFQGANEQLGETMKKWIPVQLKSGTGKTQGAEWLLRISRNTKPTP